MDSPTSQVSGFRDSDIISLGLFHQGFVCNCLWSVAKQCAQISKINSRYPNILAIQHGMARMKIQVEIPLFQKTSGVGGWQGGQRAGWSHILAFDLL